GETALRAILQSGVFVGMSETEKVLARPVLIYEYAFPMTSENFSQALGQRSVYVLSDVASFNAAAIHPPDENNLLRVFFIDGTRIWEFELQIGTRRHSAENFQIEIVPANPERMHFIATANGFIPSATQGGFSYNVVSVENPFRDAHGLFTLSHIRNRVEPFFDNPASIIPGISVDNVYTFSTRNTMVRYLENAVLEYTSYRAVASSSQINFMSDFSAALAFAMEHGSQEIYLRSYERRGRTHVFRFDYVIDNRPLVLTEDWHTGFYCTDPLRSPVEVIADNGRVVRYRRLAYTFSSGGIVWKDLPDPDEFFILGFPISRGPAIELEALY
ncbi:MAG: hypothetical protein LBI27_07540, partial [Clostridiales bacterium]|nr:hypothetical protein [Clostridiales bacterium]